MGLFEYRTDEYRPQYDMEDYFVFEPRVDKPLEPDQLEFEFMQHS